MKRPTMRQVAALAGVGQKTVSRVINGEPHVSEQIQHRVREAIAQLHYEPDIQAGNLKRRDRRTQSLGLLVGNMANPFSGARHRALEAAASPRGVDVYTSSLDDDPEREQRAVSSFLRRRVDGLVLMSFAQKHSYLHITQQRGTPIVFIDRVPTGIEADVVVSDNYGGAREAVRHLIETGHRRIAFVGDREEAYTARERLRAFLDEIDAHGIPREEAVVVQNLRDSHTAELAVRELLEAERRPTAVFSAQNLVTLGTLRALHGAGMQWDVAHVGFDDVQLADILDPPLTVIAQDSHAIGAAAAELLFSRLDGNTGPTETVVIPTTLVVRGSGEIRPRTAAGPAVAPARERGAE
ncbi:MAG: LacI family DNA-binding transcriptional regulator [Propionicimonas sp.]|nr:LacI family DNA-binding transcriptional regulator [Propionicimonas sp.]